MKASASVVAAAVVAILAAVLSLLCFLLAFLVTGLLPLPRGTVELPPQLRTAMLVMYAIMMAVSIFGIFTGIGLIRLRHWARISVLIWGGLCVCFGAIGIPFAFFLRNFTPPSAPELPQGPEHLLQFTLIFIYGLPLLVGIWWLILFNRKSVKAEFAGTGTEAGATGEQKPRCPLPVTVLAWFYLTSILNFVFLPWMPTRVPVFIFGLALPPWMSLPVLLLSAFGLFVAGVGILRLKPWSYSLIIGLQMFWLASTAVSLLNPQYKVAIASYMRDVQAWMHLPESQFSPESFMQQFGWMTILGLVLAGVILGILVYYRPRFLATASAAKAAQEQRVTP
ncbi:MAG TPA: hypothetical protein VMH48_08580 [Methylomirabilota bacterium]|nr:hypothetical protein [Methylomirabilota bacterium]